MGDDADDLLQDTWMAALSKAPPETGRPLRPWLREVLRNRARDRDRREARHRAAAVVGATTPDDLGPKQLAARLQVQGVLGALVLELPEPLRQTVLLRYYNDLTSPEIARAMGAPEGTVRGRLKEAVERLRRSLDQRHGGRRDEWLRAVAPLIPGAGAGGMASALGFLARAAAGRVVAGAVVALLSMAGAVAWWLGSGRGDGGHGPGAARGRLCRSASAARKRASDGRRGWRRWWRRVAAARLGRPLAPCWPRAPPSPIVGGSWGSSATTSPRSRRTIGRTPRTRRCFPRERRTIRRARRCCR